MFREPLRDQMNNTLQHQTSFPCVFPKETYLDSVVLRTITGLDGCMDMAHLCSVLASSWLC